MRSSEFVFEKWSEKYKSSINCSHPKGFSQRAHCAGKKKHNESVEMEMVCEVCGMCEAHSNLSEIKQRLDPKCWTGKKIGNPKTKIKGGVRVNNCVPAESIQESEQRCQQCGMVGCSCTPGTCKCKPVAGWVPNKGFRKAVDEAASAELTKEFDLIENIMRRENPGSKQSKQTQPHPAYIKFKPAATETRIAGFKMMIIVQSIHRQ
jgi:hypothetical protein